MTVSGYNTKQKDAIFACLKENASVHLTAEEVYAHLKMDGKSVGKSTVYRQLEALVADGTVKKYVSPDGKGACYQFASDACREHYHLKCSGCGALIHTGCSAIKAFADHFYQEHHFKLDMTKTVLYGLCEDCLQKGIKG
mgnify:FL=1